LADPKIRSRSVAAGGWGAGLAAVLALAAGAALAQAQPPSDPDAPTATARSVTRPAPPDAPPLVKPVKVEEQTQAAADPTSGGDIPTPKRQQLFISPMGEPFRADFGRPYPVDAWFEQADQGHKGYLTREDFKADAARFFKRLDANGDGIIDGFEVGDYETKIAPEILPQVQDQLAAQDVMTDNELKKKGVRRRPDPGGDVREERGGKLTDAMTGAAQYGFLAEPEPVRGADAKLDYHITRDEWMAAALRRFDELDKAHDGKLTLAELPHTPMQKMLEERAKQEAKAAAREHKDKKS
jgi:Ca2+-binding EF-hand superfamily protein